MSESELLAADDYEVIHPDAAVRRFASERDLGIVQRDPAETLADTVDGLRTVGRL